MKVVDLSARGLFEFDPSLITTDTVELRIPDNQLTCLPSETFKGKSKIWSLDFSRNFISNLSCLKHFGALGYLDLRNNCLAFDELLDIEHIYIAHLRIDANPFSKLTEVHPLTLPALLKRVWIIDGQFISDFVRKQARSFRETIPFGETVLACRRIQTTFSIFLEFLKLRSVF
jgi:Leucine-rich repeat (LRR) protein